MFPGAPSFNDHALSAPPRVRTRSVSSNSGGSQKTKKDPVAKLLASFAILLSLIAIAIALANSFSDRNGSATGGGGSLDTAECCSSFGQGNAAASSALEVRCAPLPPLSHPHSTWLMRKETLYDLTG